MTTYNEKVIQGRRLVKRSEDDQWRLAELTWRAVNEDSKTRVEWAADLGVTPQHAGRLWQVWDQYQLRDPSQRPTFRDAYASVKEGVPAEVAASAETERKALGTIRQASPDKRAEIARELLADETVADAALNTPETRTPGSTAAKAAGNVARATVARHQQEARRTERIANEDPVSKRIDAGDAIHDLGDACDKFALAVTEALRRAGALSDSERPWLEGSFARAGLAHESLRRYLELGRSEIDHELTELLRDAG